MADQSKGGAGQVEMREVAGADAKPAGTGKLAPAAKLDPTTRKDPDGNPYDHAAKKAADLIEHHYIRAQMRRRDAASPPVKAVGAPGRGASRVSAVRPPSLVRSSPPPPP